MENQRRIPMPGVMKRFAEALGVDERMLDEDIAIIPVPKSWRNIYTDFRKRVVVCEMNSWDTKTLSNKFHYALERLTEQDIEPEGVKI